MTSAGGRNSVVIIDRTWIAPPRRRPTTFSAALIASDMCEARKLVRILSVRTLWPTVPMVVPSWVVLVRLLSFMEQNVRTCLTASSVRWMCDTRLVRRFACLSVARRRLGWLCVVLLNIAVVILLMIPLVFLDRLVSCVMTLLTRDRNSSLGARALNVVCLVWAGSALNGWGVRRCIAISCVRARTKAMGTVIDRLLGSCLGSIVATQVVLLR